MCVTIDFSSLAEDNDLRPAYCYSAYLKALAIILLLLLSEKHFLSSTVMFVISILYQLNSLGFILFILVSSHLILLPPTLWQ